MFHDVYWRILLRVLFGFISRKHQESIPKSSSLLRWLWRQPLGSWQPLRTIPSPSAEGLFLWQRAHCAGLRAGAGGCRFSGVFNQIPVKNTCGCRLIKPAMLGYPWFCPFALQVFPPPALRAAGARGMFFSCARSGGEGFGFAYEARGVEFAAAVVAQAVAQHGVQGAVRLCGCPPSWAGGWRSGCGCR